MSSALAPIDRPQPSQLAQVSQNALRLVLPSLEELKVLEAYGEMLIASQILPNHIKTWQACATLIRYAGQIGIDEFTAFTDVYVINGIPTCSAKLMQSLIVRDHGDNAIIPIEHSAERAVLRYKRRSWAEHQQHEFTIDDAKRMRLVGNDKKPLWQTNPADMLWARCVSQVARFTFPDSIKGLYTPDEIGEVIEAQPVRVSATVAVAEVPAGVEVVVGSDPMMDRERGWIMEQVRAIGLSDIERQDMLFKRYGKESLADDAIDPLTRAEASDFLRFLKTLPRDDEGEEAPPPQPELVPASESDHVAQLQAAQTIQALTTVMNAIPTKARTKEINDLFKQRMAAFKATA